MDALFSQAQTRGNGRRGVGKIPFQIRVDEIRRLAVAPPHVGIGHPEQQAVVALAFRVQIDKEPVEIHGRVTAAHFFVIGRLKEQERRIIDIIPGPALADEVEDDLRALMLVLIDKGLCQPHGCGLELRGFGILVEHDAKGLLGFGVAPVLELGLPQGGQALGNAGIIGKAAQQGDDIPSGLAEIAHIGVGKAQTQERVRHAGRTQIGVHGLVCGGDDRFESRQRIVRIARPEAVADAVERPFQQLGRQIRQLTDILQRGQGFVVLALVNERLGGGEHLVRLRRLGHRISLLVHIDDFTGLLRLRRLGSLLPEGQPHRAGHRRSGRCASLVAHGGRRGSGRRRGGGRLRRACRCGWRAGRRV